MRSPFLGKLQLFWCDRCHVPVLGRKCRCGNFTREVAITPPGDIRPAFSTDIARINQVYSTHFGVPLVPDGQIVLLNKVPDQDRMEEIILGGAVVGALRYLPSKQRWEPIPRFEAFSLMRAMKRYVVIDEDAVSSVREGGSVLAPGLVSIEDEVRAGDEVFIFGQKGSLAGVGGAKVDALVACTMARGSIVRTRKNVSGICILGVASWADVVAANEEIISTYEGGAIQFVRQVVEDHPHLVPTVSYSGGKDSLATLLIVMKAIGKIPVIFADSGFEFPEAHENIRQVQDRYGVDVVTVDNGSTFWKVFQEQGPPAMNARWCCSVCKLDPVNETIREEWGECLSFIGQRRYESFRRMTSAKIWRNPKVPCQLASAPIQQWTALHVWLYLLREEAPYNLLYEKGFDRVGCYICPSSDLATMKIIEEMSPELWSGWMNRLQEWGRNNGHSETWVASGGWQRRGGNG